MATKPINTFGVATNPICGVFGCGGSIAGIGFCRRHLHKFRRYGDPLGGSIRRMGEIKEWIARVALGYHGEDCLIWPFARNKRGYAVYRTAGWSGLASRHICISVHGNPPHTNSQAAHSCGCGHMGCVNPMHLRWASPSENCADKHRHGTAALGERHPHSKLTDADIREIRKSELSQVKLGRIFGVRQTTISRIILRQAWPHVTDSD